MSYEIHVDLVLSQSVATFNASWIILLCFCGVQVLSHAAAAQSSSLVFLCIHREHYDFLESLAPQLKGKVPNLCSQILLCSQKLA